LATSKVESPTGLGEATALLRDTRGSVVFRGGGTKSAWGGRPAEPDLLVETGAMRGLIGHNPADMTAAVEAGMPLRDLQETLRGSGQWLAIDPPSEAAGATIGGLLATGDSGPRRQRYGGMRDLVIGVTLVLADGTVARAGGHVIKNVAGYDLAKLLYGSLGSLALVAEVVLRVHPLPQASATVTVPATATEAADASVRLLASALEPSAVDWIGVPTGTPGRLAVRFEGSPAGVAVQTVAVADVLGASGPREVLTGPDEEALWQESATARTAQPEQSTASAGALPTALPALANALAAAGDAAGAGVELASHAGLGLHVARFTGPPPAQARAFDTWRRAVRGLGGSVLLRDRAAGVDDAIDPFGPPPSAVALLRAVKSRLDPEGRCAPGRFGSWY
jgi:glycolate oxidase FAD binding subunit